MFFYLLCHMHAGFIGTFYTIARFTMVLSSCEYKLCESKSYVGNYLHKLLSNLTK